MCGALFMNFLSCFNLSNNHLLVHIFNNPEVINLCHAFNEDSNLELMIFLGEIKVFYLLVQTQF